MRKLFVVLMFCLASLHSYGQMPVEILGSATCKMSVMGA